MKICLLFPTEILKTVTCTKQTFFEILTIFQVCKALYIYGLSWWLRPCVSLEFDPWVWKIPWRREWQPTPVFSPGESHGQRSLAGYSPWGQKSWTRLSDWTTTTVFQLFSLLLLYLLWLSVISDLWVTIVTILEHQELQQCKMANLMRMFLLLPWLAVVCLSDLLWPPSSLRHNIEIVN